MPNPIAHLPRRLDSPAPAIADNPAHLALVQACSAITKTRLLAVLYQITKQNRTTAYFLSEVLHWFMPSRANRVRPRATVYRDGCYWFTRTREDWHGEYSISRPQLERAYVQCAEFLNIGYFQWGSGKRQTHYALDYAKLVELITRNEKYRRFLGLSASQFLTDSTAGIEAQNETECDFLG